MRRRDFVTLLGGSAIAWPLAVQAQQLAMPVIGYLGVTSAESDASRLPGLRRGLHETGYVEGRNLTIEYRWGGYQPDRLPALVAELIQMRVAVIVTPGLLSTLAAKAATTTIPVVFGVGADPVQNGLVASLNRPGGNLTGINVLSNEFGAKGLALFHELVPGITTIGLLGNPNNPTIDDQVTRDVLAAASAMGIRIQTLKATTDAEIDAAFVSLVQARTGALLVSNDAFFNSRVGQIVALAAHHAIPVMYGSPEFIVGGGLIGYGASLTEAYREVGLYVGRILKGERPADLPVVQASRFELVINLKTARALGLAIPARLLALVDQVIE
ncbi:ABC transporter substrate-binding protein [Bradyrhizobium sp. JYMT SZCCT0180]|uniref:ABC transporter substrate-binding protein n=1 Tax=Bradyrhizobium sp. JYMT SZCCT0180 TaxID=2807666 RepID=UPI001BA7D88E|nr:ABC transporter substrate-binding protein [Bradyrhizobium sp. JYMT SZCCT0180]MBR1211543.1 ABC transporter substrate-binding protein [Bradyrhizobium sp. JYMT SZCCT0180]